MGFFRSTTGRLMALSIAIAFVGGGASALVPHGIESSFLLCVSLFVPIVLNTAGLPMALEKHWFQAATSVVVLPLLFFLWAVGIGAIREVHPWLAPPFIVLGLAALAVAARPGAAAAAEPEHHVPGMPAHQH